MIRHDDGSVTYTKEEHDILLGIQLDPGGWRRKLEVAAALMYQLHFEYEDVENVAETLHEFQAMVGEPLRQKLLACIEAGF